MSNLTNLKKQCGRCQGTGRVIQSPFVWMDEAGNSYSAREIDCPECTGAGYLHFGHSEELITACPTSVILENTDSNEYIALDANKKMWYDLFISAGTLDMTRGTKAYDGLLAWIFPTGTSHTAIINALEAL